MPQPFPGLRHTCTHMGRMFVPGNALATHYWFASPYFVANLLRRGKILILRNSPGLWADRCKPQWVGHPPCDTPTRPACVSPIRQLQSARGPAHGIVYFIHETTTSPPGLWHSEGGDRDAGRGGQSGGIPSFG